jgi:hypothetical protein
VIKQILDWDYYYLLKRIIRDIQVVEKISRKTAEQIFEKKSVSDSNFYQDNNEIRITLKLTNDKSIIYKYDLKNKVKTYFLEQ